jgi:hypothetical protein
MTAPTDTTYNGWPNYETWRVNLEAFDGLSVADITGTDDVADFLSQYTSVPVAVSVLAEMMREQVESLIEDTTTGGIARDYALAFLRKVDWHSIATQKIVEEMANVMYEAELADKLAESR